MLFHNCEFKEILVVVSDCIFEGNSAKIYGGCIYVFGTIVDSITGETRSCEMEKIVITNCQFLKNYAIVGSAFNTFSFSIYHVKLFVDSCSFIDNGKFKDFFPFSSDCNNVDFLNVTMQYTDTKITRGFFSFNQILNANLTNCTFINGTSTDSSIKFNQQLPSSYTVIDKCNYINCVYPNHCFLNLIGFSVITSVNFSYDNIENSCGAINFGYRRFYLRDSVFSKTNSNGAIFFDQAQDQSERCIISGCTFDSCAGTCFDLNFNKFDITFSNNTIKNHEKSGSSAYICSIRSIQQSTSFTFDNINFINNKCDSLYGGGSGLWMQNFDEIKFEECKFIDNEACKSNEQRERPNGDNEYFSGDGGAFQFGYSELIYNVNLVFSYCTFTGNKAVRHGGALALQNVVSVNINHCTFENNIGNYKPSSSKLQDFKNYYSLKKEGRGGAIYLNPAFQHQKSDPNLFMSQVSITDCTFTSNFALDGHGIYIEGDDPGTVFTIIDNTFTDNYDKSSPHNYNAIILTEIYSLYNNNINTTNTFNNENKNLERVLYVLHNGLPYTAPFTSTFSPSPAPPITDDPNEIDELEIINATSKGRNEFIINDF